MDETQLYLPFPFNTRETVTGVLLRENWELDVGKLIEIKSRQSSGFCALEIHDEAQRPTVPFLHEVALPLPKLVSNLGVLPGLQDGG